MLKDFQVWSGTFSTNIKKLTDKVWLFSTTEAVNRNMKMQKKNFQTIMLIIF